MARIRTIKPDAWQDERLGCASRDARLLWTTLITMADDEGRFRAVPSIIFGHGYPHDQEALELIPGWLRELASAGLVQVYEVDGSRIGCFPKWADHQRVSKPTPSKFPGPPRVSSNSPGNPGEVPEGSQSPATIGDTADSIISQGNPGDPGETPASRAREEVEVDKEEEKEVEAGRLDRARLRRQAFDYWHQRCRATSVPAPKLTDKRRDKLDARFNEGYTLDDIKRGIDGAATNPPRSDDGSVAHDDLVSICRTGDQLERYIQRAGKPRPPGSKGFLDRLKEVSA